MTLQGHSRIKNNIDFATHEGQGYLKVAAVNILRAFGRQVSEPGLEKTPERFAKAFLENSEEDQSPEELVTSALFEEKYDGMLVENNITFYSLCEHHLLPFFGTSTVAYIPDGKIVGLSKIPRLIRLVALGPNVQERITDVVADVLMNVAAPKGVGVILKANHLCMASRGVRSEDTQTITSAVRGLFKAAGTARQEFLELARR